MVFKKFIFLSVLLLSMFVARLFAYDFEVDGIYYNYNSKNQTAIVTHGEEKYSGKIVIPRSVSFNGRTMNVDRIGKSAFFECRELYSLFVPKTISYIDEYAFSINYSKMRTLVFEDGEDLLSYYYEGGPDEGDPMRRHLYVDSVYIGRSSSNHKLAVNFDKTKVMSIGSSVKGKYYAITPELETIYISNPNPEEVEVIFSGTTFVNAILYVPIGSKEKYMKAEGWKNFFDIQEMDVANMWHGDSDPNNNNTSSQKCEKPTIAYSNGKLTYICGTEAAICHSTITDTDINSYSGNEIQLSVTYNISVYATKEGYEKSETATATLCWIDVAPKTEGITNGVANVRATAVMIQNTDGQLTVSGVDDGTQINVFNINGIQEGSSISRNGSAMVNTNLAVGSIAIVKIGEKSIKVVLK